MAGYQVGKPVISGILLDSFDNHTGTIQRTSINLWKPGKTPEACSTIFYCIYFSQTSSIRDYIPVWLTVSDGLCSTAEEKPILFGENSTSGCLLPINQQNLTQCDLLRSVAEHGFMFELHILIYLCKVNYRVSFPSGRLSLLSRQLWLHLHMWQRMETQIH